MYVYIICNIPKEHGGVLRGGRDELLGFGLGKGGHLGVVRPRVLSAVVPNLGEEERWGEVMIIWW